MMQRLTAHFGEENPVCTTALLQLIPLSEDPRGSRRYRRHIVFAPWRRVNKANFVRISANFVEIFHKFRA